MHWSPACIYLLVYKVVFPPQPTCLWAEQATNFHPPQLLLRLAIFLPLSWKTDERRKKKKVWENDWGRKGKERQMGFTLSLSLSLSLFWFPPLFVLLLWVRIHTHDAYKISSFFSRVRSFSSCCGRISQEKVNELFERSIHGCSLQSLLFRTFSRSQRVEDELADDRGQWTEIEEWETPDRFDVGDENRKKWASCFRECVTWSLKLSVDNAVTIFGKNVWKIIWQYFPFRCF